MAKVGGSQEGGSGCISALGLWITVVLFFSLVALASQVDGQFFAKSSKSIPRMGRRSGEASSPATNQYRRVLIDALLDQYGPNLIEALGQVAARNAELSNNAGGQQGVGVGEVANNYEQPLDLALTEYGAGRSELPRGARSAPMMMMMPRSSVAASRSPSFEDSSLAMRALHTNRFIQHLESGQPPMSFDRLFGAGMQAPDLTGRLEKLRAEQQKPIN